MEKGTKKKIWDILGKKQFFLLVICAVIGTALILFPFGEETSGEEEGVMTVSSYTEKLEERVRELCLAVDGVDDVEVLLTLESGSEYVYADNINQNI